MSYDDLEQYIYSAALHLTRKNKCSLEEATAQVCLLVKSVRQEYRAAGAPFGDTDEGLLAWLTPARQPRTEKQRSH